MERVHGRRCVATRVARVSQMGQSPVVVAAFQAVSYTFGNIFIVAYEKASPSASAPLPHCPFHSLPSRSRVRALNFLTVRALSSFSSLLVS